MDYQELKCKNCGSSIPIGYGVTRVRCGYCGTEYVLSGGGQDDTIKQFDYMGRGPIFRSFVPQGWSGRLLNEDEATSVSAAVCKGLRLDAPGGASLYFYPFAYFKDFCTGTLALRKDYSMDPITFLRYKRLSLGEDYARERLHELFGDGELSLSPAADRNSILRKRYERFLSDAAQTLKQPVSGEYRKFGFKLSYNGRLCHGYFATATAYVQSESQEKEAPPKQAAQPAGNKPAGLLDKVLNFKGVLGGPSLNDLRQGLPSRADIGGGLLQNLGKAFSGHDWGRAFDFIFLSPEGEDPADEDLFDAFCAGLDYCSLYYALQDEEMVKVRQIQLQGAQQRQQNAINAQRELHRTQSQTSDIINSGYWQRSQRIDNVRSNYSEAVRGVNSYVNTSGQTVEADVKYERVYQWDDSYVGSTRQDVDPGGQWQELKRRDK